MKAKIRKINPEKSSRHVTIEKMPLHVFRKEFGHDADQFNDEQLEKIRDFFYVLAEIAYEHYQRRKEAGELIEGKIIDINTQNENNNKTESDSLYQGVYRRAS
jgi:hypothetical protein